MGKKDAFFISHSYQISIVLSEGGQYTQFNYFRKSRESAMKRVTLDVFSDTFKS